MKALVGYTGFVGSNILKKENFDYLFNSKNIKDSFGLNPDLLVYAGVGSEMFLANNHPEKDLEQINDAINNIKQINPKKVVLISTIAVYDNYNNHDEDSLIISKLAYGSHRHILERFIMENYTDYLIIRLPALFGTNIKKNFIYDILNPIPKFLNANKYNELIKNSDFKEDYTLLDNGFYKLNKESEELLQFLKQKNFTALNFTDSRNAYQFYNLNNLWEDIEMLLEKDIKLINLVSEPLSVKEIYDALYNEEFVNYLDKEIINQNLKTKYGYLFNNTCYIKNKDIVLKELIKFIKEGENR